MKSIQRVLGVLEVLGVIGFVLFSEHYLTSLYGSSRTCNYTIIFYEFLSKKYIYIYKFFQVAFGCEDLKSRDLKNKCYYLYDMNFTIQGSLSFGNFAVTKKIVIKLWGFISNFIDLK